MEEEAIITHNQLLQPEELEEARALDFQYQHVATLWAEIENDLIASDMQMSKRKLCEFAVELHELFRLGTPEAYVKHAGLLIQNVCTHNLHDVLMDRDWMPDRSVEEEPLKPIYRLLGTLFTIHTCHRTYGNYVFAHTLAKALHRSKEHDEEKFASLMAFFELYGYSLLDVQKTASIIVTIQHQCDQIISGINGRDLFVDLRTVVEAEADDDDELRQTHFFSWNLCRKYVFDK
jgi:predicted N-acyltransferase